MFSLDLKHGRPITNIPEWQGASAIKIADAAIEGGFTRMIVLDLASVGLGGGPSVVELCASIRERHPSIRLISGGGVRDVRDIEQFCAGGCESVLVASALHDGSISPADLSRIS